MDVGVLYISSFSTELCGKCNWKDGYILSLFHAGYLTSLSVSRIYSVYDTSINERGAGNGMKISRGDRSTRIKPALLLLFPLQIAHHLTWDRTRAAALETNY